MKILTAFRTYFPPFAHKAAEHSAAPTCLASVFKRLSTPTNTVDHPRFGQYNVKVVSYKEHQALASRNFAERLKQLSQKPPSQ